MAFGMAAFTGIFGFRVAPLSSVLLRALGFHPIGLSTRFGVGVLSQLLLAITVQHVDQDGSYPSRGRLTNASLQASLRSMAFQWKAALV